MKLRFCTTCLYPESKPDLFFDEDGVCSACTAAEEKTDEIDWKQREEDFREIIGHYKNDPGQIGYDCLVPVSGGKNSTYQAYLMKEVYGMNPLCVCFETTMVTELGQKNLDNLSRMGMDVIHFKKNSEVYRKMVIEGFKRVGDEMWPNHIGIFTIPVMFAVKFGIPLVIWGENPQQEYGGPLDTVKNKHLNRKWLEEFGGLLGNRIQDMVGVEGITESELTPYYYPSDKDIESVGVVGLFLGHYFYWDGRAQVDIVTEHGFEIKEDGPVEGTYTNYENLDEKLVGLHDYLKYVKYGFGRATDHACLDIRNNLITRDEGKRLVLQYDGKYPHFAITEFIKYSGLSREEIDEVIDSYTNPKLFKRSEKGKFLKDAAGNLVPGFNIE